MKTIVLSANPTPNMNLAKINIDNAGFDPHCGPSFWVTFYNPTGNIIDRITHNMTFDQWQDWTSESSEIADYKYIADSITEDLGITYTSMDYPLPPVAPTITIQPVSQSNQVGNSALFSVGYIGDSPFTLHAGSYTVKITNAGGSVTSAAAVLTVIVPVAPTITTQPESKTVEVNGSTSLSVQAEGTQPLVYTWYKDGVAVPASIGNMLPIMTAQTSNEGIYSVKVSNMVGSVTSNDVTVTVTTPVVPEPVNPEPAAP